MPKLINTVILSPSEISQLTGFCGRVVQIAHEGVFEGQAAARFFGVKTARGKKLV